MHFCSMSAQSLERRSVHIQLQTYTHTYIHTCIHTCTSKYVHEQMGHKRKQGTQINIHIYIYIYLYTTGRPGVWMCTVCTFQCTYLYMLAELINKHRSSGTLISPLWSTYSTLIEPLIEPGAAAARQGHTFISFHNTKLLQICDLK